MPVQPVQAAAATAALPESNMRFSIIIPTLNEASNISSCLKNINTNIGSFSIDDIEVIVVDGGSKDKTIGNIKSLLKLIKTKIIRSDKPGLPLQLNRGASEARGDILLFLHADCRLPSGALEKINEAYKKNPDLAGGAFTMRVEGSRFIYRVFSVGGNIYCRLSGNFFGDRAIFIRKDIFKRLSGYRPLDIMSDFDLSRKMKKEGSVILLKGPVVSSGRKFENESFYRIIFLTLWSLTAFYLGINTEKIKEKYYGSK